MKKIDVFRLPKQRYFLRIEDWQVAFCEGDKCAAAMLDFFSNRHEHYLAKLEETEQRNKALNLNDIVEPYTVQTISKISDYTLGIFGRNKIIDAVQYLVGRGVVLEKKDLQNNKSYFLNTEPVQQFIDKSWIPFIEALGKNDNPLQCYLSKIGFTQLKRKTASLISNDESGSLKSNEASLISNDETPIASLIINEASLKSNDNIVRNSKNDSLVRSSKKITTPNGADFLSQDELEDLEGQVQAQKSETHKAPPVPQAPPAKKKESKWNGSFSIAKKIFDAQQESWALNRFGVKSNGIYWDAKECGQLSNLLTRLKSMAALNGDVYDTDIEFVETALPMFLGAAAKLDKYYSNEFTPTLFTSKFNTVVTDIKNYLQNGNTKPNGRNGHQFDAARTAYMESLLD